MAGLVEKVLLPGEEIKSRVSYGEVSVAASSRGIFIVMGSSVTIVPPRHVQAIMVSRDLTLLVIGILFLILGMPMGGAIGDDLGFLIALLSFIIGVSLAVYGYLRQYQLTMIFAGGSVSLKGDGRIIDVVKQLRELTEM